MCNNLKSYSAAAYPAVAIATPDEERVINQIVKDFPDRKIMSIAAEGGMRGHKLLDNGNIEVSIIDDKAQYPQALALLCKSEDTMLIMMDYQHLIKNATAYRRLKLCFPALKSRGSMVVLIAPHWQLPAELKIPTLESPLPTRAELESALKVCADSVGVTVDNPDPILDAACGQTMEQAENSFALSYAEKKSFDAPRILAEKLKTVKADGRLEIALPAKPEDLGGLDGLREYINAEVLPNMRQDDLRVRGLLFVGVPGTGKSLAARVIGSMLNWPVLKCDVSSLKGSLVGQSEQNMRAALKLAEAVSPCVLFMDEIEKAVGGYASSAQTDGGTSLGMLGSLLNWMQEHRSPIIIIATCNDYAKLPAELTRAGRIDERFFVDLPTEGERTEIAVIHLKKYGCPDGKAPQIAALTDGWTGAEIEQLVKSLARRCSRLPSTEDIVTISKEIKPISRVRAEEIGKLRDWGKAQLRIANTPEKETSTQRKVRAV